MTCVWSMCLALLELIITWKVVFAEQLLSCPYTHPHTDIQPAVETLLVAWMDHFLHHKPLGSSWTAIDGGLFQTKPDVVPY